MLVVSGFWLGIGLLSTLVMGFVLPTLMHQQAGKHHAGSDRAFMVVMIAIATIFGVLLPAVFLFFYTRKSVRATCLAPRGAQIASAAAGETPAAGFPVPLAILGGLHALGSLFVLAGLFVMPVTIMFGTVLHGAAAVPILLAYVVAFGYAAWMIFRKELIGWQLALVITGFGIISMLVTCLRQPDMLQLFREMGYGSQALDLYERFPHFLLLTWVGTFVMMAVYIAFVLYTRKYFPKGG
jgi:hypothetical protein